MKTKDTSIVGFMCQITPKMYLFFPWKSIFSGWKKWGCEAHIFRWNGRFLHFWVLSNACGVLSCIRMTFPSQAVKSADSTCQVVRFGVSS